MTTIRFIGPWGTKEQQTLRAALRDIQQYIDFRASHALVGKQWICRCRPVGPGCEYSARHAILGREVCDRTFLGLLKRIYRLAWERDDEHGRQQHGLFVHG